MKKLSPLSAFIPGIMATCRYCGSTDVRQSKGVFFSTRYVVYRCNHCGHRFKVARITTRHLLPIMSFLLVVLLFFAVVASIYVSTTQLGDLTKDNTAQTQ